MKATADGGAMIRLSIENPARNETVAQSSVLGNSLQPNALRDLVTAASATRGRSSQSQIPVIATSQSSSQPTLELPSFGQYQHPFVPTTTLSVLTGCEIACSAAQQWAPADALRQRGRTIVQLYCDEDVCMQRAAQAMAQFLNCQAITQEDIGAASAMRAYYTRIALQEQMALANESISLIDAEEEKQSRLQLGGVAAGTDTSRFERKRLEVADSIIQLEMHDRQLRTLLAHITQFDYTMDQFAQEQLDVREISMDLEGLKSFALEHRMDLQGWSHLSRQVNENSAPMFAQMLTTAVGSWGIPLPRITPLKKLFCRSDVDYPGLERNMRQELATITSTHRQWISQAVEEKYAKVVMSYQRVAFARQTIDSWQDRIDQLERLENLGTTQPEQVAEARATIMEARSQWITRRLEARSAEIDLAESVGGIAARCCCGKAWLVTGLE
ncbi:MAG: TolC family protein [Planctomycetales bacterium]|nr:TolC family protein [Planctomycetales bacterium]